MARTCGAGYKRGQLRRDCSGYHGGTPRSWLELYGKGSHPMHGKDPPNSSGMNNFKSSARLGIACVLVRAEDFVIRGRWRLRNSDNAAVGR